MSLPYGTLHLQLLYIRVVGHAQLVSWIIIHRCFRSSPILWHNLCHVASWLSTPLIWWYTYKILWVHQLDILGTRTPIPFRIVTNLCREVTELTWHHNITLWFTSVPKVIIGSLFVFPIILYTNIILVYIRLSYDATYVMSRADWVNHYCNLIVHL
jgi:hypothetical protein